MTEENKQVTPEHFDRLNETLASLKTSLDDKKPDIVSKEVHVPQAKAEDYDLDDLNLDDEQADKLNSKLKERDERLENKIKGDLTRSYSFEKQRADCDVKLNADFPDLGNKSSAIYKETVNVINEKLKTNPKLFDEIPSAAYDAAAIAAYRIGYKKNTSEDRRLSSLTGGYIEGSGAPPPRARDEEPTDVQKYVATQLGVSTDVYKKYKFEHVSGKGFVQVK